MEGNIIKPITIRQKEFVQSLKQLIENSGLPYFVIENVLSETTATVKIYAERQLEYDITQYNESMKRVNEHVHEQEQV